MRISTNTNIYNRILDADFLPDLLIQIQTVADLIYRHGWAEANAGNLSVNISQEVRSIAATTGNWFIVSRTGSRYRSMALDPLPHLVFISMEEGIEHVYPAETKPTSEWGCHRLLQQHLLAQGREEKVVLHTHPANIIAMSRLDIFRDEGLLNRSLNEALPELPLFLPQGVAAVPYAPFGSSELAECSLRALGSRKALIWQGHGIVCIARTMDESLDFSEVVEKACQILLYRIVLTK